MPLQKNTFNFIISPEKKSIILLATVLLQLVSQGPDPRVDKVSDRNFKKGNRK